MDAFFELDTLLSILYGLIDVVFGDYNKALSPLFIGLIINTVVAMALSKSRKETLKSEGKKYLAYLGFIIMGNQVDGLASTVIADWKSTTQFLVSIALAARELKIGVENLSKFGIPIPSVLATRIDKLENIQDSDPKAIDNKIEKLKGDLAKLQELQQLQSKVDAIQNGDTRKGES